MQSTALHLEHWDPHRFDDEMIFEHDGFYAQLCMTPESLDIAYELRYRAYRNAEAISPNTSRRTHDHFDEQPNTRTHLIWHQGKPVASVRSAIWSDRYNYLPTEGINAFRSAVESSLGLDGNILESCRYVTDPDFTGRKSLTAQLLLFRIQDLSSRYDDCSTIITAVRQRHVPFYERMLGFQTISESTRLDWIDAEIVLLATGQKESRQIVMKRGMPECSESEVNRYFELCSNL